MLAVSSTTTRTRSRAGLYRAGVTVERTVRGLRPRSSRGQVRRCIRADRRWQRPRHRRDQGHRHKIASPTPRFSTRSPSTTTCWESARELAYLNKGIGIRLTDERVVRLQGEEFYSSAEGLSEFVTYLNRAPRGLHPLSCSTGRRIPPRPVEEALQRNESIMNVVSYCNNINNGRGGRTRPVSAQAPTRTLLATMGGAGRRQGISTDDHR